jgi:hypothetical protein
MSDEQPTEKELAEAAALAEALEDRAARRAPVLEAATPSGPEALPQDALEVAALVRLLQPGAAFDKVRAEAVLADVLGANAPVVPARKPRSRWLWGGVGVASSFAVAALGLLMLRSQGELEPVASAPSAGAPQLQPSAAVSAAERVASPAAQAPGPAEVPAPAAPKIEALEPALAEALARNDRRAVRRAPEGLRAELAESAKQITTTPALPSAATPPAELAAVEDKAGPNRPTDAVSKREPAAHAQREPETRAAPVPARNAAAARLIAAQEQIAPGAVVSIALLERAQAEYRAYLRLQPGAAAIGAAHARADSELTRGQLGAAIGELEAALGAAVRERAPSEAQTDMAFRAGALALQLGDAARALRVIAPQLARAAAHDPSVVSLLRLRAQAQRAVGDTAGGAASDERAQSLLQQLRAP